MITSKDNEIIKNISKLVKSAKRRKESRQFTAEGVRICTDGILSGYSPEVFLYTAKAKEKYSDDFKKIADTSRSCFEVSAAVFEKISDTKSPQGFFCVFNMLDKNKNLNTIDNQSVYIALERVQDPSNMGTILRTAEALGVDGIILSNDCCDIFSPKVVRGSMGAVFRIKYSIADDFCAYIKNLSDSGIITYGSTPVNACDIRTVDFNGGVMLIGNEGNGLSAQALDCCTVRVSIPMNGRAESLNAACAASILMWEMIR